MSKQNTRATIDANIKQNGQQQITGEILNTVLNTMVTDYAEQAETTEKLTDLERKVDCKTYGSEILAHEVFWALGKNVGDVAPTYPDVYTSDSFACGVIKVQGGDVVTITTKGGANARAYAVTDEQRVIKRISLANITLNSFEVEILEDGFFYYDCTSDYYNEFKLIHKCNYLVRLAEKANILYERLERKVDGNSLLRVYESTYRDGGYQAIGYDIVNGDKISVKVNKNVGGTKLSIYLKTNPSDSAYYALGSGIIEGQESYVISASATYKYMKVVAAEPASTFDYSIDVRKYLSEGLTNTVQGLTNTVQGLSVDMQKRALAYDTILNSHNFLATLWNGGEIYVQDNVLHIPDLQVISTRIAWVYRNYSPANYTLTSNRVSFCVDFDYASNTFGTPYLCSYTGTGTPIVARKENSYCCVILLIENKKIVYNAIEIASSAGFLKRITNLENGAGVYGGKVTLIADNSILVSGASFAYDGNGWFEDACQKLGVTAYNKAVGSTSILNNAAAQMMDYDSTKPHGSLFMNGGSDVFLSVDVFVIFHAWNYDVFLPKESQKTLAEYESIGAANLSFAQAFDYVMRKYQYWCSQTNKACQIALCTHWHDARTIYNDSIRKVASRFGACLVDFDKQIGWNKESLDDYTGKQVSLNYAYNLSEYGSVETIDGVEYGWHPDNKVHHSAGEPLPYIQKKMSAIFRSFFQE